MVFKYVKHIIDIVCNVISICKIISIRSNLYVINIFFQDGLDDDEEDEVLTPEAEKVLEEEPKLTKSITLKRKLSTIDKSTTGQVNNKCLLEFYIG